MPSCSRPRPSGWPVGGFGGERRRAAVPRCWGVHDREPCLGRSLGGTDSARLAGIPIAERRFVSTIRLLSGFVHGRLTNRSASGGSGCLPLIELGATWTIAHGLPRSL